MNFISTFDELNKLYEEADAGRKAEEACAEEVAGAVNDVNADTNVSTATETAAADKKVGTKGPSDNKVDNKHAGAFDVGEVDPNSGRNRMVEAADVEEIPAEDEEIEIVDDEPRQVICECDKCGALVIKNEADIVINEETDLVNIEEECQFCEEANGYKIIGVVAPYEVAEEVVNEEPVDEEPAEEEPVDEAVEESETEDLTEAKTTKQRLIVIEPGYQYKDKDGSIYTLYGDECEEDDTGITYNWDYVDAEDGDIYIF